MFQVLQSQAQSLNDPIALEIYEKFATRMEKSKLGVSQVYPVRAIANRSMIDPEYLPSESLARNLQRVEEAIANGQLLELNRFPGGGKFAQDEATQRQLIKSLIVPRYYFRDGFKVFMFHKLNIFSIFAAIFTSIQSKQE